MKKVAIMTWHQYENYGGCLQCFALYNKIQELGYDVDFVNYSHRPNNEDLYRFNILIFGNKYINKIKNKVMFKPISEDIKKAYDGFKNKYFTYSVPVSDAVDFCEIDKVYDAFVCGSDQIWSPHAFDPNYFLPYVTSGKLISYAPSFGQSEIKNKNIYNITKQLVERFKYLSVRENNGAQIISDMTGRKAEVVSDPTLLYDNSEWDKFFEINNEPLIKGKYIFCYALGDYKKYTKSIKEIKKYYNCDVYLINNTKVYKNTELYKEITWGVGPAEFINLIKFAEHVCTDSFHGTVFSIIYNKHLTVFKRFTNKSKDNQNSRIYNILDELHILDRLSYGKGKINPSNYESMPDYVYDIIKDKKQISEKFLYDSLKDVVEISEKTKKALSINNDTRDTYSNTLCCGCGVCQKACPKEAIKIIKNKKGFFHYNIDKNLCVKCGRCVEVCPFQSCRYNKMENENGKLFSLCLKDKKKLQSVASGGAATAITEYAINNGMDVIGCIYNKESHEAEHIKIDRFNEIERLKGSKYLQSNTQNLLTAMDKKDLKHKVVFGTPCQIAGIRNYLKMNNLEERYILVDLICHGVPSYLLWQSFLREQNIEDSEAVEIIFRNKKYGWKSYTMDINKDTIKQKDNDFYSFFSQNICLMESCYECPYRLKSAADIRIGDFWGEKYKDNNTGMSMVVANTYKGQGLVDKLHNIAIIKEHPMENYRRYQYPYNDLRPIYYNLLLDDLANPKNDLRFLRKKYCTDRERKQKIAILIKGLIKNEKKI